MWSSPKTPEPCPSPTIISYRSYAMASRPLRSTSDSSLSDGPAGFFSPRSHLLTESLVTLRYEAKTDWLTSSRLRYALISWANA